MKLSEIRAAYIDDGYGYLEANARTSQDVVLSMIAKTALLGNITIKGGVVMQHISGDSRRATQDLDFDFIRYSLGDDSIRSFIEKLNAQLDGVAISITAPIEELKHQDYHGKRVYVSLTDTDGTTIDTKLDIGVHKDTTMEQALYCFDLAKLEDSVTLLVNTKEQIFAEKLKSLLRLGALSTRYKDVFDMYWLATQGEMDKTVLMADLDALVYRDKTMRENSIDDIVSRLTRVSGNAGFIQSLGRSRRHNWLNMDSSEAMLTLVEYFKRYDT